MSRRNRGFALVELQVALAIALITLSAVLALYLFSWRSFTIGNTLLDVYSNSRNASGWLTRDIRCAAQVVGQYPETGSPTYQTGDNRIVLKAPSTHKDTKKIISGYNDHIIYYLSGNGDLMRVVRIDERLKTVGDLYYAKNYRNDDDGRAIARYCGSLTFRSGDETLSDVGNLSTVNTVAIYLPINKSTISLSGAGSGNESINPTTVVRLRNK